MKKENDGEHPASHYLAVGDPQQAGTWHLRVKDAGGKPDHGLMGAAKAALGPGYRGNRYEGPDKAEATSKLKALYKAEGMNWSAGASEPVLVVTLDGIVLAEAGKATKLAVAAQGTWVKGGRKFTITAHDLETMVANFAKLGTEGREKDDVVCDFEHAAEFYDPTTSTHGYDAAGWVKALLPYQPGDRYLYAEVEFTSEARQRIADKKVKYVSPVIYFEWPDKRTGKNQGPTLVSLALTNRPFLEELPAVSLSDRGFQLVDLDQVHVSTTDTPALGGKEKTVKKVNISAIKGGDKAGHLKVSHPDFPDGDFYADKDDASDALGDAGDVKAGKALAEATGLSGQRLSEQIPAVKQRFGAKVITLAEVPAKGDGPDKGAPDFSAFAPAAGTLVAAEVFEAQLKEAVLAEAVQKRQIVPKERAHLRKLALGDLRAYLAERTTKAVDETEQGHAAPGSEAKGSAFAEMQTEVDALVAAKRAKGWGEALRIIATEKPELRKRYSDEQLKERK